jgi:2-C-methyl-D-erythritol 2,4-cyclodiphosphate synthase
MRVGWGVDAHRFSPTGQVVLGGVVVDESRGVAATSDGDVVAHAVVDALLGAAALGDIGERHPEADSAGADSMGMVREAVAEIAALGFRVESLDVTVVAQDVRIAPHRDAIRGSLADALGADRDAVSVKATTTDGMGFTGRGEGLAAMAAVVLDRA